MSFQFWMFWFLLSVFALLVSFVLMATFETQVGKDTQFMWSAIVCGASAVSLIGVIAAGTGKCPD